MTVAYDGQALSDRAVRSDPMGPPVEPEIAEPTQSMQEGIMQTIKYY